MRDSPGLPDTEREIRSRTIGAGQARSVVIRRRYAATIEDVWAACTEPDRLNRWFLPVSGELHEGGTFQVEGNAGGRILRCARPHRLQITWEYGDRPVDEVELRLAAAGDGTVLELEHATVTRLVEWEGQMLDVLPDMGPGWEMALVSTLPRYLRGELPDAPATEWYSPTPEDEALDGLIRAEWAAVVERDAAM